MAESKTTPFSEFDINNLKSKFRRIMISTITSSLNLNEFFFLLRLFIINKINTLAEKILIDFLVKLLYDENKLFYSYEIKQFESLATNLHTKNLFAKSLSSYNPQHINFILLRAVGSIDY